MEIKDKNINECIKVMAAAGGLSLAEIARRMGDSPQGLNQRMKTDKLQKSVDYLEEIAAVCGFRFVWSFEEIDKENT